MKFDGGFFTFKASNRLNVRRVSACPLAEKVSSFQGEALTVSGDRRLLEQDAALLNRSMNPAF